MSLFALYNPISGDGTAESFLKNHVIPILSKHGRAIDQISATQSSAHAGQLILDFLKSRPSRDGKITVILCSGDGTLHDIVNVLQCSTTLDESTLMTDLNFVLVPCGTANALFASLFPPNIGDETSNADYKLQSVRAYIDRQPSRTTSLVLARTTQMPHHSAQEGREVAISLVVVSTSLHASILSDSEKLRNTIPGIERFKVAARNNATKWYKSCVKLSPGASTSTVQLYDPKVKAFINHPDSTVDNPIVNLDGPFLYFLSTVNVDRLEPKFQITSLAKTLPPTGTSCDVVIIRPLRDPSMCLDNHESRKLFAPKLWSVLGGAYEEGRHIGLRYDNDGDIVVDGDGPTVVEYIRCGGWEWIPDIGNLEPNTNLLCSDGAISHIENGSRVICSIISSAEGAMSYNVYT